MGNENFVINLMTQADTDEKNKLKIDEKLIIYANSSDMMDVVSNIHYAETTLEDLLQIIGTRSIVAGNARRLIPGCIQPTFTTWSLYKYALLLLTKTTIIHDGPRENRFTDLWYTKISASSPEDKHYLINDFRSEDEPYNELIFGQNSPVGFTLSTGQYKLKLVDFAFIMANRNDNLHIIAIGGSPGHHFKALHDIKLFSTLHIIDPRPISKLLSTQAWVTHDQRLFDINEVSWFESSKNTIVIWDVRTDSQDFENWEAICQEETETAIKLAHSTNIPWSIKFKPSRSIEYEWHIFGVMFPQVFSGSQSIEHRYFYQPKSFLSYKFTTKRYLTWAAHIAMSRMQENLLDTMFVPCYNDLLRYTNNFTDESMLVEQVGVRGDITVNNYLITSQDVIFWHKLINDLHLPINPNCVLVRNNNFLTVRKNCPIKLEIESYISSFSYKVKQLSCKLRFYTKTPQNIIHSMRAMGMWEDRRFATPVILFKHNRVYGIVNYKGKMIPISVPGHAVNIGLISCITPVDYLRYVQIVSNMLKGFVEPNLEDNNPKWHTALEYMYVRGAIEVIVRMIGSPFYVNLDYINYLERLMMPYLSTAVSPVVSKTKNYRNEIVTYEQINKVVSFAFRHNDCSGSLL